MVRMATPEIGCIEEEGSVVGSEDSGEEDKVYVAVKEAFRESNSTLVWALKNVVRRKVVLVHVHRPVQFVNLMGGPFPVSQLTSEQIKTQRILEQEKLQATLEKYALFCESAEVKAEKLVIEMGDVAKGLIELITVHGITKLVMGAARDKCYSKNMKKPKSMTAITVQKQAPSSCNMWFVCKGRLIFHRSAGENSNGMPQSFMSCPNSNIIQSKPWDIPSPSRHLVPLLGRPPSNPVQKFFNFISSSNKQDLRLQDGASRSPHGSYVSSSSGIDDAASQSGSASIQKDDESEDDLSCSVHDIEEDSCLLFPREEQVIAAAIAVKDQGRMLLQLQDYPELLEADDSLYDKMQEIISEVEKLKRENFEESRKWHKAEREATEAKRKTKALEIEIAKQTKLREEVDEALVIQKQECEAIKSLQEEASEELKATRDYKKELEDQLAAYKSMCQDLEEKLSKAQDSMSLFTREREEFQEKQEKLQKECDEAVRESQESKKLEFEIRSQKEEACKELTVLQKQTAELENQLAAYKTKAASLNSLERERVKLQQRLDEAIIEKELLRSRVGESTISSNGLNFVEFSCTEIKQATQNFESSMKIAEGGYGTVYRGCLRHTTVAIKVINPHHLQDSSEFLHEVEVLSRLRHPNVIMLLGTCLELKAVVYEYLPNGSLEDHLMCENGSNSFSWEARTRICAEICLALIYLHSSNVIHGDLKPENVLLDANFVSKLSANKTDSKGTFIYRDPEFPSTGNQTPQSDIYEFGILVLRLLTGMQPLGIVKQVQDAVNEMRLHELLDPRAGSWPFVQAQQLVHLGLRCSAMNSARRPPNLATEILTVLEPMTRTLSMPPFLPFASAEDTSNVPSYFLCPIFQEVMSDPHVAADGFTYEAEAIKGWLEAGHDTSPMTNVKLPTRLLIPNHALRSTIQEWLQQQLQH